MHRDKVLVDVAREQAFVRITDKHDLLGGLEGVVHLKEASFQSVRLVHGVDGGAGQIEDYLACLGTVQDGDHPLPCLLYTSPSPRDHPSSRMPSSA